ncbi:MAG: glutaredoxin domain-containing protein [Promethearchaeota archaeon]
MKLDGRRDLFVVCVVYSSSVCPRCEALKQYLQDHNIEHTVRMVEEPDAQVDALMLNIYNTPALVIDQKVLHQSELFANNQFNESTLTTFLRSNGYGPA